MVSIKGFYLIFFAIVNSFILCSCTIKPAEITISNYIVNSNLTSGIDSVTIKQLIDTMLESTVWNDKVQINKTYDAKSINIYLLDGNDNILKSNNQVAELLSNCFYAGSNIIFLDIAYLNSFLQRHHVVNDSPNVQLKVDRECFFYWAIGHELGHLICGHKRGHFETASLDKFVATSSIDNLQELQADSFFVHVIVQKRRLLISMERLMLNILNTEIEQKIGKVQTYGVGLIYDYTNEHVVSYAKQPTHPEYVIRLSRMLELSSKASGDKGLYNLVGGFIKQLKEVK